jgi:hypothetical protein
MELKKFSTELKMQFNAELETITADQPDALVRTTQLIVTTEKYVHELKRFVIKYDFKTIAEEIHFFKMIKPDFVGLLWYYKKLFRIQLFEAYNASDVRLKYYRRQLKRLETFIDKNRDFYQYVFSDADDLNEKYFTRSNSPTTSGILDDRFSTPYAIRLSKIQCNGRLRAYLNAAIESIERPKPTSINSLLTWTGSKTDLIELIYALQAAGVFNKKEAEVKQIASLFENMCNINLGNYYRVFQEIRQRKTGQTNFINQLREQLMVRIKEMEK